MAERPPHRASDTVQVRSVRECQARPRPPTHCTRPTLPERARAAPEKRGKVPVALHARAGDLGRGTAVDIELLLDRITSITIGLRNGRASRELRT